MIRQTSTVGGAKNRDELPELLTLKEASELLKCHPNTLRQWDKKGILPAIRIGEKRVRRYRKEDLLKFLETK
jgi:excisionase family DNA binding protein